jgi:hypothetical protein
MALNKVISLTVSVVASDPLLATGTHDTDEGLKTLGVSIGDELGDADSLGATLGTALGAELGLALGQIPGWQTLSEQVSRPL